MTGFNDVVHIKTSDGLGDAIYLRAIVIHLIDSGCKVNVYTLWPDAFAGLPIEVSPLGEANGITNMIYAHQNTGRDNIEKISNFEAGCRRAGIHDRVNLELKWTVENHKRIDRIRKTSRGKNILVFQPTRKPRRNKPTSEFAINANAYKRYIESRDDCYRIQLGLSPFVYADGNLPCELNLFGQESINGAFDIATIADVFFGEQCYIPMLGEALNKSFVVMFSRSAIESGDIVGNLNPDRCFHKKHLGEAIYDG